MQPTLTAILPCNDLDRTEAFFVRLGFKREKGSFDDFECSPTDLAGTSI